jgi:hypothetical protein
MWSLDLGELLGGSGAPATSSKHLADAAHPTAPAAVDQQALRSTANGWIPSPITPCILSDVAGTDCTLTELSAVYQFRTWKPTKRQRASSCSPEVSPSTVLAARTTDQWRPGFLSALSTLQHHPRWSISKHENGSSANVASHFIDTLITFEQHLVTAPSALYSSQTMALIVQLVHYHFATATTTTATSGDVLQYTTSDSSDRAMVKQSNESSVNHFFAKVAWKRFQRVMWPSSGDCAAGTEWLRSHHREATALITAVASSSCDGASGTNASREFVESLISESTDVGAAQHSRGDGDSLKEEDLASTFLHGVLTSSFLSPYLFAHHNDCHHHHHHQSRTANSGVGSVLLSGGQSIPLHLAILIDVLLV